MDMDINVDMDMDMDINMYIDNILHSFDETGLFLSSFQLNILFKRGQC